MTSVEHSTTTQPISKPEDVEKEQYASPTEKNESQASGDKKPEKAKRNRPRIEFSSLPDTIEELEALIKEIRKSQGKRPEFKEREQQFQQIDSKINKEQEQIKKLKEKVYEKNAGNLGALEDQLKQVQAELETLNGKVSEFKSHDQVRKDSQKQAAEYIRTLIDSKHNYQQQNFVKGFEREDKILDEIEKLNFELSTKTHVLKKEKVLISTVGKLEASLAHIPRLHEFDQSITLAKQKLDAMKDRKKDSQEHDEVFQKLKQKIEKRNELYQKIKDRRAQNQAEYDSLKEKRNNVAKLFDEKKKLSKKYSSLADEFHESERKITTCELKITHLKRKQEIEERQRLFLERQAKREAYAARIAEEERLRKEEEELQKKQELEAQLDAKRKEEEERLRNPHAKDIEFLKPLISYLKTQLSSAGKRQKNKNIQHPVDKTVLFPRFGVSIPKVLAEIPPVVNSLEKKLQEYEKEIIDVSVPIEEVRKLRGVEPPTEQAESA